MQGRQNLPISPSYKYRHSCMTTSVTIPVSSHGHGSARFDSPLITGNSNQDSRLNLVPDGIAFRNQNEALRSCQGDLPTLAPARTDSQAQARSILPHEAWTGCTPLGPSGGASRAQGWLNLTSTPGKTAGVKLTREAWEGRAGVSARDGSHSKYILRGTQPASVVLEKYDWIKTFGAVLLIAWSWPRGRD